MPSLTGEVAVVTGARHGIRAAIAAALAAAGARVTAQTLVVDGGYSMFGAAHSATRLPGHASDDA